MKRITADYYLNKKAIDFLIIDKSSSFRKNLRTTLPQKIKKYKLTSDRQNGHNMETIVATEQPDIAIIEYELMADPLNFLRKFTSLRNNFIPLFVIILPNSCEAAEDKELQMNLLNAGAAAYHSKYEPEDALISKIEYLANNLEKLVYTLKQVTIPKETEEIRIERKTYMVLSNLFITTKVGVYRYIFFAVKYAFENPNRRNSVALFKKLSEHFGVSSVTIKQAITKAINKAYENGAFDGNPYNFNIKDGENKPSVTEFLEKIIEYIIL